MDENAYGALVTLFTEIVIGTIIVFFFARNQLKKFLIDTVKITYKNIKNILLK